MNRFNEKVTGQIKITALACSMCGHKIRVLHNIRELTDGAVKESKVCGRCLRKLKK